MQTHRNMLHNVLRHTRNMQLQPQDRISLLASPGGGQGMGTTWCALLNGAALCLFSAPERGVTGLNHWLKEERITVYISSVSVFRHFIRTLNPGERFPDVRLVRFASEPADAGDFAAWQQHFSKECVLLNTLSSTETGNITSRRFTWGEVVAEGRLPVGRASAGIRILLVDEQGQELRDGEAGEIVVKGRYLSPGYWRNKPLTAERFNEDGQAGVRLYRSGDLGRRASDGSIVFMGRRDARIKIRGYRVEISEVESALSALPDVRAAVVSTQPGSDNEPVLIGYVVPRGRKSNSEALRRSLRAVLPSYMIPSGFVFLETLPLTPGGKVDRQALPSPDRGQTTLRRSERPRDIVETSLTRIWETVLGIRNVGRHDDFFDLGGNSIQSAEVLARIEEAFGASLSPSVLTEHGTIEHLAGLLTGHVVIPSPGPLVPLRRADSGRPLFLVHSGQGDVATYGLLARRLPDRPVYGLQSVGMHGEAWPLMTIPGMAKRYLREVLAVDPTGPYQIGGTCMGGLVAFEMAQQLVQEGREVALLALFDVPYPLKAREHYNPIERWYGPIRGPVRDAFRILRWSLVRALGLGRGDRWMQGYRRFVARMNARANRLYFPGSYPGELTLFITVDTPYPHGDLRLRMRAHAKESRVITISGIRRRLYMRPTVDELARKLQEVLERAETPTLTTA